MPDAKRLPNADRRALSRIGCHPPNILSPQQGKIHEPILLYCSETAIIISISLFLISNFSHIVSKNLRRFGRNDIDLVVARIQQGVNTCMHPEMKISILQYFVKKNYIYIYIFPWIDVRDIFVSGADYRKLWCVGYSRFVIIIVRTHRFCRNASMNTSRDIFQGNIFYILTNLALNRSNRWQKNKNLRINCIRFCHSRINKKKAKKSPNVPNKLNSSPWK